MKKYNLFSESLPKEEKAKFETEVAGDRAILDASELLHSVMKQRGFNQKQLAEILGVTKGYMSRLLSGSENLSVKNVAMVLHALGYSYKQVISPLEANTQKAFAGYNTNKTEVVDKKSKQKKIRSFK